MKEDLVIGQNQEVGLLDGSTTRYVNLDNAASTPAIKSVLDEINNFMPMYSSVHRGAGLKSRYSTQMYEGARKIVRDFVGGNDDDHLVIFSSNTTEAINKLSYQLDFKKSDIVLLSALEHHSNDLPWRFKAKTYRIKTDKHGSLDEGHLQELLDKYGHQVRLVAITGASNVTGHIPNIHKIAEMTHKMGAELLVDAAQLAPHRSIDIKPLSDKCHIDYLTISAHKMYAPFGTGALITRKDSFATGAPVYSGGGTVDFVGVDDIVWTKSPERDEAGSPNVVGAVAMASAMTALNKIGMKQITEHEIKLTKYAVQNLLKIPGLTIYGDHRQDQLQNRTGVISFTMDGLNHALVASVLSAEWGIGVRSGCFCAHPYVADLLDMSKKELEELKRAKVDGSHKKVPGLVRVSFGLYNMTTDIDCLVRALKATIAGKHAEYCFDPKTDSFETKGWPRV